VPMIKTSYICVYMFHLKTGNHQFSLVNVCFLPAIENWDEKIMVENLSRSYYTLWQSYKIYGIYLILFICSFPTLFHWKSNIKYCPHLYYPVTIRKNEYVLDYLYEDLTSCVHICFSNVSIAGRKQTLTSENWWLPVFKWNM
jgi:hypothetical protein